jgi:membrane-associated phospholipid phosphatase
MFALLVALASAVGFARVAEDYLTNDPLARWDVSVARWLFDARSATGIEVFRIVTVFGSPAFVLAVATALCIALFRRRRLEEAVLLVVVLGGAELLNVVLKLAFQRQRPEVAFVHLDTYSFPSGHAMMSTATYSVLAYLLWGRLGSRRARLFTAAATACVIALVCFSRLYLGVHYLSDVLGGVAGGATWVATSVALQMAYGRQVERRIAGSRLDRIARRVTHS